MAIHADPLGGSGRCERAVVFDYISRRPVEAAIFNAGMTAFGGFDIGARCELVAGDFFPAKWMDLGMLTLVTGRERPEVEYRELCARASFRLTRLIPTARLSTVEGAAA